MKIAFRQSIATKAEYRDVALRQRKEVIMTSIRGISRMINSRKTTLALMAQYLKDQYNCERVYRIRTIYERGPVIMKELAMLEATRKDLYKLMGETIH